MLIAMTAFAVVAAILSVVGSELILGLIHLGVMFVAPVALATLAYYCRGRRRTFWAGALAGSLSAHYFASRFGSGGVMGAGVLLLYVAFPIVACGFTALWTRRYLERRGWDRDPHGEP